MAEEKKNKFEGLKTEDIKEKVCQLEGKWSGNIYIDNQIAKTVDSPLPNRI